jgi:integrase
VGSNPIRLVDRRPVQAYAGAEPLSEVVVEQRLRAIDRATLVGKRDYALLVVFLQTGRRLSEVAGLEWRDIALTGERVTLIFRRTKGGKVFRDTLPRATSAALLHWLHALHGAALGDLARNTPLWVSLSRNGTAGHALSRRAIARICEERVGTSKVHALRHTFARAMESAGAKVSDIQARLGHASMATTGQYLAALRAAENPHGEALEAMFGVQAGDEF